MIGKSYDGSLAAAAATTGVAGLTTVVTESGPYRYDDYTRSNGVAMDDPPVEVETSPWRR